MAISNVQLFGFTDSSYSQPISGFTNGQIGATGAGNVPAVTFTPSPNPVQVPVGQTYYFELRASVSGVLTGSSVVAKLLGDASYPTGLATNFNVGSSTLIVGTNNFVWSGNSTSTSNINDVDWSNGASLPGLPSSGLIQSRSN